MVSQSGRANIVDTAAEKSYLAMLAARLNIQPELATELRRQVAEQMNSKQ